MSMNLTKWTSNSTKLRQIIPSNDQDEQLIQSVLGILWNIQTDVMNLQVKSTTFSAQIKLTKRRILKEAATVFDPMGWAMPVVLTARIFIRKIWAQNYGWDESLPENLVAEWQIIRNSLANVSQIKFSRKFFADLTLNAEESWELHMFSDTSMEAYAAVAFIRSHTNLSFVASKARLSPKTKLSIPRLELLGAVIAARFASYISNALKTKHRLRVTLWSDSKCVLSWLQTTKILPAYVQKTIQEIRNHQIAAFNYVPSEKNPADVASRGSDLDTLKAMKWWKGPSWLHKEEDWPKQELLSDKIAENMALRLNKEEKTLLIRTNVALKKFDPAIYDNSPFSLDPKNFSTLENLLKRSGYILHALNRVFLTRIGRKFVPVEKEKTNFNYTRTIWLKWDQKRAYENIPLNKKSNVAYLQNIAIFADKNEIIRCGTRLQKSGKEIEAVYPILLVKNSPLTELIVMSIHLNNFHSGTAYTLAALRRNYWLPQGRQQVFKILKKNCTTCQKHKAKPFTLPEMAPLPEFRVQKTETPFRNTGLDVFGPITTRTSAQSSERAKKWVVIFTCMIVRAVHLEVIDDMSSAEFLEAFRRFSARRGVPSIVVSDNAPQFHVVERRFVSVWHYISEKEDVVNYFTKKQISWKFIPPHSPWMGGVYERLIKSIKYALEKTHPTIIMTHKQFVTVIVEIEAMMNSRPISYVDKDIATPIITPNHFLSVRYPAIPANFENSKPDQIDKLWRAAIEYLNTYWKIWSEHYVSSLRERVDDMKNKHFVTKREPQIGEIVLMVDPETRRSLWRKAIIERLIRSDDGKIRSVQIKLCNGGRMIRPINKILPLDLLTDLPEHNRMELNEAGTALVHQPRESVEDEHQNGTADERES